MNKFQAQIYAFYKNYKRDFPWRHTNDPYYILISEVMLQQTQTYRVLPKYLEFLKRFPTVEDLASAPLADVLTVWSGLGYNRRARFLQQVAKIIVEAYQGNVPSDPKQLDALPGIGHTTASAVAAFSYNRPVVFIETNIRRVFIHFFFPEDKFVSDKTLLPLVAQTLDKDNSREWYWALMDYGAHLASKVGNPNRRSAHYTKQSAFEGSVRKVRGEILRLLLYHREINRRELFSNFSNNSPKAERALDGLVRDGLLKVVDQTIQLA